MTHLEFSDWRYAHGLSQTRLAKLLGVSRLTVFRWENGYVPLPENIEQRLRDVEFIITNP